MKISAYNSIDKSFLLHALLVGNQQNCTPQPTSGRQWVPDIFVHQVRPLVCSPCSPVGESGGSHAVRRCVCCYGAEVIPHVSLSEQMSLPAPLLLLLS